MELLEETKSVGEISDHIIREKPALNTDDGSSDKQSDVPDTSYSVMNKNINKCHELQNDDHLSELEHQVENAEARCGTLQQQLEYMIMLCQDRFDQNINKPDKSSYSKGMLQSLESDTSSLEKDSKNILNSSQATSVNNVPEDKEEASLVKMGQVVYFSPASDGEWEDHNSNEIKNKCIASSSILSNEFKTKKNDSCTFINVPLQSFPSSSSEHPINSLNDTHTILTSRISSCENNSVKDVENTLLYSNTETYDTPLINTVSNININDVNTVLEIETKNGVVNPVKTIKGILNGLTDSIGIISQLNVQASETERKRSSRKHRTTKRKTSSLITKIPTMLHVDNMDDLQEEIISKDDPGVRKLKAVSVLDEHCSKRKSQAQMCHHHHNCHYNHRRNHHSEQDSLSCRSSLCEYECVPEKTNFGFYEEGIYSFQCPKQNRSKDCRHKERLLLNPQKFIDVKPPKLSPDARKQKLHSKKRSKARTNRIMKTENWYLPQQDSEMFNILINNPQEKKRTKKTKNNFSQFPEREVTKTENIQNTNNFNSIIKCKKTTNPHLNREDSSKPSDEFLLSSLSKNIQKSENSLKTEIKHLSCNIRTDKNLFYDPSSQGVNSKLGSETFPSIQSTCYEPSRFSTPTVSSKLKQTERPIMNIFNFQNIPFVAGSSTTRSHNLALNLQQALSIIKLRSSSLSLGSDLATEVASTIFGPQSRPSTAASCTAHNILCPVAEAQIRNPKSLSQEDAHNSDYTFYEGRNDKMFISERYSSIDTLESASRASISEKDTFELPPVLHKENVWEIEQDDDSKFSHKTLRCTCFPTKPCVDYQKVLYEYISNGEDPQFHNLLLSAGDKKEFNSSQNLSRSKDGISLKQTQHKLQIFKDVQITLEGGDGPMYGKIQTHSKELKEVLLNMHEDFKKLNEKYEQLQNDIEHSEVYGKNVAKELEKLESELNAKENDIMTVLGLLKQLTSLKQQVKALHTKASSLSLATKLPTTPNVLHRESTTTIRLTRLLRTIQRFQEKLLNE